MEEFTAKERCLQTLNTCYDEWGSFQYYCMNVDPEIHSQQEIDDALDAVVDWFKKRGASYEKMDVKPTGQPYFLHIKFPVKK